MEKHAGELPSKATFIMVCIQDRKAAQAYSEKHALKNVTHIVGKAPDAYGLQYIPHHVVFDGTGKVIMNYDKPTKDYMSLL